MEATTDKESVTDGGDGMRTQGGGCRVPKKEVRNSKGRGRFPGEVTELRNGLDKSQDREERMAGD